jgi:hypothetical protein
MARRRWLILFAAVSLVALTAGSYAVAAKLGPLHGPGNVPNQKKFDARLNGFQEVPSVSTTGYGEFDAELVNDTTIHYVFRYAGLEGGTSLFAHVHFAQRSVNGGVAFFLCGGGSKPDPCPNVEGTVEGDVTPSDVVGPNGQGIEPGSFDEIVRAMQAGHSYVNIHTTRWPGGEIRGQINDKDQKEFDK